jgi:hypothetical protein
MKSIDNSQIFLENSINSQRGAQQFTYHRSIDKFKSVISPASQFTASQTAINSFANTPKPSEINVSKIL